MASMMGGGARPGRAATAVRRAERGLPRETAGLRRTTQGCPVANPASSRAAAPPAGGDGGPRARRGRGHVVAGDYTDRTLGSYAAFLRRRAVLVVLLGAGLGGGYAASLPPAYVSSVSVVSEPIPTVVGTTQAGVERVLTIDTDAELATSGAVVAEAAELSGWPGGAQDLARSVRVTAVPNSRVMRILVTGSDPRRASTAAQALAEEFLRLRGEAATQRLEVGRKVVNDQIQELLRQTAARRAVTRQRIGQDAALQPELRELRRRLLRFGGEVGGGYVAEPARVPRRPVREKAIVATVSGALLGLLAAVVVGQLRDASAHERAVTDAIRRPRRRVRGRTR
ncbi:MAG: hypothetical protein M3Q27_10810 [Actinomycetota bacterium]|nr:hypothetical protein [Actinomycetota bacterium]